MSQAVPKTPFDVAQSVRVALSPVEKVALYCVERAAREGRIITKEEICAAIGSDNIEGGTASGVIRRLEEKGYVKRHKYQRGLMVCIPSLGICTAEPRNKSPHWRDLPRQPSVTIQTLHQRASNVAMTVEQVARRDGRDLMDLLAELVRRGLADHEAERNEE